MAHLIKMFYEIANENGKFYENIQKWCRWAKDEKDGKLQTFSWHSGAFVIAVLFNIWSDSLFPFGDGFELWIWFLREVKTHATKKSFYHINSAPFFAIPYPF